MKLWRIGFVAALVPIAFGAYRLGKDMALRDNARDRPEAAQER